MSITEICALIDAKLAAHEFLGLAVKPSQDEAFTFDIMHSIDPGFDRKNVSLADLVRQVENVKLDLETFYG